MYVYSNDARKCCKENAGLKNAERCLDRDSGWDTAGSRWHVSICLLEHLASKRPKSLPGINYLIKETSSMIRQEGKLDWYFWMSFMLYETKDFLKLSHWQFGSAKSFWIMSRTTKRVTLADSFWQTHVCCWKGKPVEGYWNSIRIINSKQPDPSIYWWPRRGL